MLLGVTCKKKKKKKKTLLFSIVDDSVSDYNVEYFKEGNNLWINTLCRQILKKIFSEFPEHDDNSK